MAPIELVRLECGQRLMDVDADDPLQDVANEILELPGAQSFHNEVTPQKRRPGYFPGKWRIAGDPGSLNDGDAVVLKQPLDELPGVLEAIISQQVRSSPETTEAVSNPSQESLLDDDAVVARRRRIARRPGPA